MKKSSKRLSLVLMGSLGLGVGGCSSEPAFEEEFITFDTVNQCVEHGGFTATECSEMAADAIRQSPTFETLAECEQNFGEGNCAEPQYAQNDPQRRSMWMPLMAGYMMGRYMNGNQAMYGAQPLYKDPAAQGGARSFRTAGGATVAPDAAGRVANPGSNIRQGFNHTAKPMAVRTGTTGSRGGFAGTGTASS